MGTRLFHTLVWTVFSVAGQLLVGLVAAMALERITRGRAVLRLGLDVPWAFPAIVMAFGWRFMLDPLYGVANRIMMVTGVIDAPIAAASALSMPIMVLMNIWFGFPFMMVAIIAGLAAIPQEQYEAAKIDGANWWQGFIHHAPGTLAYH